MMLRRERVAMTRKIRDLVRDLRDAGFQQLPPDRGKGNHILYRFEDRDETTVTLDGKPGDDAKHYQEKDVREAIKRARNPI
jgi:predicted RNA binding protein YcfA (HicA-like mRNA interferase family)